MQKVKLSILLLCILFAKNAFNQIIINEAQYSNKTTLKDSDGDSPDWIELYNKSNEAINLQYYSINDENNLPEAWILPNITIEPNAFIIIFASGKNNKTPDNLHADFKLSNLKDSLFLYNPNGLIIDSLIPECVPIDKSIGFISGIDKRKILSPTPGASNNGSTIFEIEFKPDTLIVDKASGKYNNGVEINFLKHKSENNIFFTLNGNEPDEDDSLYTQAIVLNDISKNDNRFATKVEEFEPGKFIAKANIIRAQAYSQGCPASNEISNTYFVGSENAFTYNVPIISIITEKDNLFDDEIGIYVEGKHSNINQKGSDWEREAHIEYFDTSGTQVIDQNAGIRLHGRSSRWIAQKSFRLYAKEKYGNKTFYYPFFNQKPELNEYKTLLLRTTYADWSQTLFKDELCHRIVETMNIDYMAGQTNVVFVNGEYWGVYSLRERQDEHYIENNYNIENPNLDIISFDAGAHVKSGSIDNYQNLLSWLNSNNPTDEHFYTEAGKRIDLQNITDYFIAQLYLAHFDFPNLNVDIWRSRADTAKWRYFFFDLDAAMIKINYDHLSNYNNNIENLERFKYEEEFILSRLLENETFRNNFYLQYLHNMETTFNTQRILDLIDFYEKQYTPLIAEQAYRWQKPIDVHKWNYNLNELKNFAIQRPSVVINQLLKNFDNPFKIFPNPSSGSFTLKINDSQVNEISYSVYNALGKPFINNATFYGNNSNFHDNLKSGIYMIQVKINGFYFREKLIVQ